MRGKLPNNYLVSPSVDFLMLGGLSILAIGLILIFKFDQPQTIESIAWGTFYLSFVCNYPHFAASYQLFYGDHRKKITQSLPWFFVGVMVPAAMFIYLLVAYVTFSVRGIEYLIQAMFIIVGWHYVKQVFGCVLVTSSRNTYFFTDRQKLALRCNLISIWSLSLSINYQATGFFNFHTIPFTRLFDLDFKLVYGAYALVSLTLVWLIFETLKNSVTTSRRFPPWISFIPFVAIYFWYLPLFGYPAFMLMVPFFHSLQYLIFVYTYKKNEKRKTSSNHVAHGLILFFAGSVLLGGMFMDIIPKWGDFLINYDFTSMTLFMAMFGVFINIHHYFLDHVLWKKNIPEIREYLFST